MNREVMPDGARNVALLNFSDLAFLNIEMARVLKDTYGCVIHLYVSTHEAVRAHEKYLREGLVASVTAWDVFYADAAKPVADRASVIARAQDYETRLQYPLSHVLMTMRDAGRGFALAGLHHPRVPGVDALSNEQCIHGLNEQIAFWEREFREKNIGLAVHGFKHTEAGAKLAGTAYRYMYSARQDNRYYWAQQATMEYPDLKAHYEALSEADLPAVNLDDPYFQEVTHQALIRTGNQYAKFARKTFDLTLRQLYLLAKGYRGTQSYSYWSTLAFYLRNGMDMRALSRPPAQPLSFVKGRPFVFFPLQTEPEQSVQWMSPECLSQLALIASVARDLPAGVTLVVKDTVHAVGRRPREFYKQILEFKNVVLLDVREKGLDVIKEARALAVISGSAGIEAAVMGRPVILFGRHNGYEFLDHVHPVYREEDLRPALLKVLDGPWPSEKSRADGARLRAAIQRLSFDLVGYTNADIRAVNPAAAQNAAEALLDSVGWLPARQAH